MIRPKFQPALGSPHSIRHSVIALTCLSLVLLGTPLLVARFVGKACAASNELTATGDYRVDRGRGRFERYLAHVQPLLHRYGYAAVTVAVMAEGVGIPLPGQTLLIAAAFEASEGRMNIVWLLFVVTAAATAGNSIGYAIGIWGGRALLNKLKINPARQQRVQNMFERRGGIVILVARFVDGLRQLNGLIAGAMRMPWRSFTLYNAAGALLWTCAWGLGTYYLGRDIHGVVALFHHHRWLLYGLSATAVILFLAALLRHR